MLESVNSRAVETEVSARNGQLCLRFSLAVGVCNYRNNHNEFRD